MTTVEEVQEKAGSESDADSFGKEFEEMLEDSDDEVSPSSSSLVLLSMLTLAVFATRCEAGCMAHAARHGAVAPVLKRACHLMAGCGQEGSFG